VSEKRLQVINRETDREEDEEAVRRNYMNRETGKETDRPRGSYSCAL